MKIPKYFIHFKIGFVIHINLINLYKIEIKHSLTNFIIVIDKI